MTQINVANRYSTFIGIDVDKHSYSFTVKERNTMNRSKKIPADPKQLYNYIKNSFGHKKVLCAYEAGGSGFGLYDYLKKKRISCLVIPPSAIPVARNEKVKNNRIDSQRIADYLKADNKIKPIRVPEGSYRELRHLTKIRENYVQSRTIAKQRIKALLLSANLYSVYKDADNNWSYSYIENLKQISCSEAVRLRLNMLLLDLEYARNQTLAIHRQLKKFCQDQPEIDKYRSYLQSIPGIGFISAVSLLARIGDPSLLKNERELGAFLGLVPREHSTGDAVNQGSITHLGNQRLRGLLIEAAWTAIRIDTQLGKFFERIKSRHHPRIASRKAIVAVARKLTLIIYRILKEQRNYVRH